MSKNRIILKKSNNDRHQLIGWFMTYTPLELIEAAGLRPYRILGTFNPIIKANALLQGNICSYVLSILDHGLIGGYNFLCGIVIVNYCDAIRRMYDSWVYYLRPSFSYVIDFPKIQTSGAEQFFYKEMEKFKKTIESHFQIRITDEDLINSILLYNETRSLLKCLYSLRKQDNPPLTGTQILEIMNELMIGNRKEINERLRSLLKDLKTKNRNSTTCSPRILLSGSFISDSRYFNLVEESGAIIVCDDLCMGMKSFDMNVKVNSGDPLKALSQGYIQKMPSALVMNTDKRVENLIRLVEEYQVDGIIYQTFKFCNPHIIDIPYIKKRLRAAGIPILFLEKEHMFQSGGQLKTRVQAFLELL